MLATIDAHQHFWRLSRGDYTWLTPDLPLLYRDFEPEQLAPLLHTHQVGRSIAVQAAASVAETRFLLRLADAHPWIAGVIGWVDFESPEVEEQITQLAAHPRFLGVRPMIQDLPDPNWMLGETLTPAFAALQGANLRFEALVRPEHLGALRELLVRQPGLPALIDHGAKPAIAEGRFEPWASDIARIASDTAALCKFSGLAGEAEANWTTDSLRPYADHLLACFGAERLVWGSDWPVVELAGGYARWHQASLELLSGVSSDARAAILGGNAARFYGLEDT